MIRLHFPRRARSIQDEFLFWDFQTPQAQNPHLYHYDLSIGKTNYLGGLPNQLSAIPAD